MNKSYNQKKNIIDRELLILEIIQDIEKPTGSGKLSLIFEEKGIILSQPTIGRILNRLENYGYLEKKTNKGRIITEKGKLVIAEAKLNKEHDKYKTELYDFINNEILENFLLILDARKVIESAIVKLAAKKINDKGIEKLEQLLKQKNFNYKKGINGALIDI